MPKWQLIVPGVKFQIRLLAIGGEAASPQAQKATTMQQADVLTLQEAAFILRCHPKTLRIMACKGQVPGRRVGRLWRFSLAKLKKWMDGE